MIKLNEVKENDVFKGNPQSASELAALDSRIEAALKVREEASMGNMPGFDEAELIVSNLRIERVGIWNRMTPAERREWRRKHPQKSG